jgi:general secretion pathway protein C
MNSNGPEKYGKGASWSIYGQGKNNLSASSNTGFFDGQSFSLSKLTAKQVVDCQAANYYLCHILAQHDAAYFRFAKGQMNNEALIFSRWITPCIMFVLLIFCGQQGYVIFKDYKKVTNKLANAAAKPQKTSGRKDIFTFHRRRASGQPASGRKSPARCRN